MIGAHMPIGDPIDLAIPLVLVRRIDLVQVHHTAGSELDTPAQVEQHAMGRGVGFREDPYHIHVWRGPDQGLGVNAWRVSWGRDPERAAAGSEGENAHGIAVVVHGDYSRGPLPTWARDRLIDALVWVCQSCALGVLDVWGHRELPGEATLCPGFDMFEIRRILSAEVEARA